MRSTGRWMVLFVGLLLAACGGGGGGGQASGSDGTGSGGGGTGSNGGGSNWPADGEQVIAYGASSPSGESGRWYLPAYNNWAFRLLPSSQVLIDGMEASADEPPIGHGEVVWLRGTVQLSDPYDGQGLVEASEVRVTHMLDGPVDAVDLEHGRLVVVGSDVFLRPGIQTFDGQRLGADTVKVGDRLLVAGHPTAAGAVVASGIGLSPNAGDYVASGIVRSHDATTRTFLLNGVRVHYPAATTMALPNGVPIDGQRVLVRASRASGTATLDATSIADDSAIASVPTGTFSYIQGVVTSVTSPTAVTVDGLRVTVPDSARASCSSPVTRNSEVRVYGRLAADGSIAATEYCVDSGGGGAEIQGTIDSVDPATGAASVLGFTVQIMPTALFVNPDGTLASINDFQAGERVRFSGGYGIPPGVLLAYRVATVAGPVADSIYTSPGSLTFADPVFFVHGRPVGTDDATVYLNTTRAEFFTNQYTIPFCRVGWTNLTIELRVNDDGSLMASQIYAHKFCRVPEP